jgi:type VI secretion system protein ImpG
MEDLLPYFERELQLLRRYAAEFANRFPLVAGRLQTASDDPHAERVLQGVALLSARVAKRLDDGHPQFTEALLESMYPHCLRPFPACAVVAFEPPAQDAQARTVPRGTPLDAKQPVAGVHCRFTTASDVTLAPVAIRAASFDPLIRAPAGTRLPPDAVASLSITIASNSQRPMLSQTTVGKLRVFIDGDPSFCAAMRDAFFAHACNAFVEASDGTWQPLPAIPLTASGFEDNDALIPFGERSHPAWRVLLEYFCFPDKFLFVDIDLAALRPLMADAAGSVTLHLALARVRPDSGAARMLRTLQPSNLRLFCTTAVNLFAHHAKPITVTHRTPDYPVVPDVARPQGYEVYSLDSVRQRKKDSDGNVQLTTLDARRTGTSSGHWTLRHDDMLAVVSAGYEKLLSITNHGAAERSTLSVEITCTNRDLPRHLPYGAANGDLTLSGTSDGPPVHLLAPPSGPFRFPAGQAHWRLISGLTLNHRALIPDGLQALRDLLTLHDLPRSPVTQRLIGGIVGLDHVQTTAWMRHQHGASIVYGIEVRITVDEEAFTGSGIHLFAQVMDRFLGLYVQMNSFIELVVLAQRDKKELIRCKRRSGSASPA